PSASSVPSQVGGAVAGPHPATLVSKCGFVTRFCAAARCHESSRRAAKRTSAALGDTLIAIFLTRVALFDSIYQTSGAARNRAARCGMPSPAASRSEALPFAPPHRLPERSPAVGAGGRDGGERAPGGYCVTAVAALE